MSVHERQFHIGIDHKGQELVATIDPRTPGVRIFPLDQWKIAEVKIYSLDNHSKKARHLKQVMIGYACNLLCDKNGDVTIPAELMEKGDIDHRARIIDCQTHYWLCVDNLIDTV